MFTAHDPASVALSGSVKIMVVMTYYSMLLLFTSTPFEHEPIGLTQLIKDKHGFVQTCVAIAPSTLPAFITPGDHLIAVLSGYSASINIPSIIGLGESHLHKVPLVFCNGHMLVLGRRTFQVVLGQVLELPGDLGS